MTIEEQITFIKRFLNEQNSDVDDKWAIARIVSSYYAGISNERFRDDIIPDGVTFDALSD